MKRIIQSSTIYIALILFFSCSERTTKIDYALLDSLVDSLATNYIEEFNVKGLSVGFIDINQDRFEKAYGNVDAATFFPMASVTKVITACAIMQLVEAGRLNLDADLRNYLPDFELKFPHADSPKITPKHILTHSSGLTRDAMHLAQRYCPVETNDLLDYINLHRQVAPAGYRHAYSNPGFELLALVIENISGQAYQSYVQDNILEPLNMNESFFDLEKERINKTKSFTMFSKNAYEELPINYMAAGGLNSNVPEMLHLVEMLLQERETADKDVLKKSSLEIMFSRQNADVLLDTDIKMGISLFLEELPEPFSGYLIFHGGGAVFTNNMMMFAPDYGIGVVVFSNTAGSYQFVEQLARSMIYKALKIKTGYAYESLDQHIPEETSWSFDEQVSITGNYVTQFNVIQIKEHNGSIVAKIGENVLPLKYYKDGFFSYHDDFYLTVKNTGKEKILFYLSGDNITPMGRHQEITRQQLPESWVKAVGTYSVVSPCDQPAFTFYESLSVSVTDNLLFLGMLPEKIIRDIYGISSETRILLNPLDESTATMQGFGRYSAEPVFLNLKDRTIRFSGLTFVNTIEE